MIRMVELAGETFPVEPVHRLALAVTPIDALSGGPVSSPVRVGREVRRKPARRRRRGAVLDPLARYFDIGLAPSGTSASNLLHLLNLPSVPAGTPTPDISETVIRLTDPMRRYVHRRINVPVWSLDRVEQADLEPPTATYISAATRSVGPWLLPGSAYQPTSATTGLRGQLVRGGQPVRWARVQALDSTDDVLGRAHGDDRGEFLLIIPTTGSSPPVDPSFLPIRLAVWVPVAAPPPDQQVAEDDPLRDLVVDDAVRRDPAAPAGSVDPAVIRGEAIPPGYQPATFVSSSAVTLTVGELLIRTVPFDIA
jgi:hypothetical protein